ncbi:MAG: YciI family protein, partial [Pseudomonadota bacterium]
MKYMLILADNEGDLAELQKDEAAFQAYMAPWMEYTQNMQEAGVMVSGEPLEESSKATCVRVRDGKRLVEDGPFVDSKEQLG